MLLSKESIEEYKNPVISNFDKSEQDLRIYCSRHLKKLFNPFNKDTQKDFDQEEIDLSLDSLTHVLKKEVSEERLQGLDQKFYVVAMNLKNKENFGLSIFLKE